MRKITTVTTALALLVLCSGVVLAPPTAGAVSEITGITISPSLVTRGSLVTITVTGKGDPCASIDLDFGDGMRHETLSGPFPRSTTHIYTSTGTRTLRARGVKGCTGDVTKTLTVSATSPDRLERPRSPIVPPPAATPTIQPPKPKIETDVQREFARMPIIEEFRVTQPACIPPDPALPILSYTVSNNVMRVQIGAVYDTGRERQIYEWSDSAGRSRPAMADRVVKDPAPDHNVVGYALHVKGASGQSVGARLNYSYLNVIAPTFELLESTASRRTRQEDRVLRNWWYEYRIRFRGENIERVSLRAMRGGTLAFGGPVTIDGSDLVFDDINLMDRSRDVTLEFSARGRGTTCGGIHYHGLETRRTALLRADSPPASPPPPPPSTTALPDLVPVIDPHDGAGLTFRIENRGRAAATAFSVSIQCDGCVGTTPNPSGFDRTERIEPGGSWASPLVSIGVRTPDRSLTRPSEWVNVSVSTPNRESDTTNNRATRNRER